MNDTPAGNPAPTDATPAPTPPTVPAQTTAVVPAAPPQPVLPDRPFDERTASLAELKEVARLFSLSSQFKDVSANNPAQAFAKMMVGRDLGIPMTRALFDVQMIQGKPTLSANLMAGMIKKSGKYRFVKRAHTDQECAIEVFERVDGRWETLGVSTFTMKDAERAGLTKNPTWKNFPKNMLFSRVISNIAKQECGDVFLGSVYTPDELDPTVEVNEEGDPVARKECRVRKVENDNPYLKPLPPEYREAPEVVDAEVIEAPAGEETLSSVAKDIEDLAVKTNYDLAGFLKKHKLSKLTSLDLTSLKNQRNNLRERAKVMAVAV